MTDGGSELGVPMLPSGPRPVFKHLWQERISLGTSPPVLVPSWPSPPASDPVGLVQGGTGQAEKRKKAQIGDAVAAEEGNAHLSLPQSSL